MIKKIFKPITNYMQVNEWFSIIILLFLSAKISIGYISEFDNLTNDMRPNEVREKLMLNVLILNFSLFFPLICRYMSRYTKCEICLSGIAKHRKHSLFREPKSRCHGWLLLKLILYLSTLNYQKYILDLDIIILYINFFFTSFVSFSCLYTIVCIKSTHLYGSTLFWNLIVWKMSDFKTAF